MLSSLVRPAVLAHRGASAFAPENTRAAFELAIRQGADAIELDVKLSRDQAPVIIHDSTVDRTTDGSGRVSDLTLEEIRRLQADNGFGDSFTGERIPTLDEILVDFGGSLPINVELTNYASPRDALPERVAEVVRRTGREKMLLFSSFHPLPLLRLRRQLKEAEVALLVLPGRPGFWARWLPPFLFPHQALHPHHQDVEARLIQRAHRSGRRVHPFTVNERNEMLRLLMLGVDGLFTDDPPLAQQVRQDWAGNSGPDPPQGDAG